MGDLLKGGDAVLWFIVLFLPGFISVKVYGLLVATHRPDFSKDFFSAVAYSLLNFAFFLPFLAVLRDHGWLSRFDVLLPITYLVLFIAPAFWAWLFVTACERRWIPFIHQALHEKAWDFFFSREEPVWVVATMTDGTKLAGFFAGNSYASAFPNEEQLYVQQEWLLGDDDTFLKPVTQSSGFIVNASNVKMFEFYEYESEGE